MAWWVRWDLVALTAFLTPLMQDIAGEAEMNS